MAHHGSTPMPAATGGIAAGARRRRLIRAFESHQAHGPESARTLAELGLSESRSLQRLLDVGVVVATRDSRYYLQRERWTEYRRLRRLRAMLVLVVAGLFVVIAFLISRPS